MRLLRDFFNITTCYDITNFLNSVFLYCFPSFPHSSLPPFPPASPPPCRLPPPILSPQVLIREVEELFTAAENLSKAQRSFSDQLKKFKFDCIGTTQTEDEQCISESLEKMGNLISDIEDERDRMLRIANDQFIQPLISFRFVPYRGLFCVYATVRVCATVRLCLRVYFCVFFFVCASLCVLHCVRLFVCASLCVLHCVCASVCVSVCVCVCVHIC